MDLETKGTRICPICHNALDQALAKVRDYISAEEFSILACSHCRLGATEPQPHDLGPYYREYHGGRHGKTASFRARRRAAFLRAIAGPGNGRKLLDIGCGEGTFLLEARADRWDVTGTEMEAETAHRQGLRVVSHLSECRAMAPFSCATLWHSLEHMRDPVEALLEVRELLAAKGLLLVAVPDAGGWQASLFGRDWLHLDVPRHLFHFSAKSLRELLHRCGFAAMRTAHEEFEYDVLGWSQSALNKMLPTQNLFFRMLTGKANGTAGWERATNWVAGSMLSTAAVPLTWLGAICRRGGTLVVAARIRD